MQITSQKSTHGTKTIQVENYQLKVELGKLQQQANQRPHRSKQPVHINFSISKIQTRRIKHYISSRN